MKLFFWKDTKKVDAFARAIADELYSQVQPENAMQFFRGAFRESMKKHKRTEARLTAVIRSVRQFSESESLGIYGKARLQQQFNYRLLELGYDKAVVDKLVEIILLGKG